jgi:leucyl aminopeptidase
VRHLTALPPALDARAYRRLLGQLARRHELRLRWHASALRRLGCGAFLAVARGMLTRCRSPNWLGRRRPNASRAVGRATVDTGGTNLKPHRHMLDMHGQAGSASPSHAGGARRAARAVRRRAWLAISRTTSPKSAYRPQDVVRAANGTTIR